MAQEERSQAEHGTGVEETGIIVQGDWERMECVGQSPREEGRRLQKST